MSLGNWFRRLFSPSVDDEHPGDQAILREEYGEEASDAAPGSVVAGGPGGLAGLESVEAAEAVEAEFEPPPDPAP
jgi:hypothetical protein